MKLAIAAPDLSKETIIFARQFGIKYLKVTGNLFMDKNSRGPVQLSRLRKAIDLLKKNGLQIAAVLLPQEKYSQFWNVKLGRPERDKEIQDVCRSIEVIGKLGIPVVEYVFNLIGVHVAPGSVYLPVERGGAYTRHFDWTSIKDNSPDPEIEASSEEVWERLIYFLNHIVPAAEASEVRLAVHPDDPPASPLQGDPRILGSLEGLKRLIEVVPSEANGLSFCQGTIVQMGADAIEAIRYFGSRDRINHVHFRNVRGSGNVFDEAFIDNGDVDMIAALQAYKDVGYNKALVPDHWPWVVRNPEKHGEIPWPEGFSKIYKNPWEDLGGAYTLGYIKALMQSMGIDK